MTIARNMLLADMQARVDAARLLVYRAAQAKQDHEPFSHLAAMGKLYAAEAATNVTRRCAQLVGYDGYSREFPFERLMRDAKITRVQVKYREWLYLHGWALSSLWHMILYRGMSWYIVK